MEVVGRRWNGRLVQAIGAGCQSFSDIRRHVEGLSDAVLARRLRELEGDGLVARHVLDERPPAVRYTLTESGVALLPVLEALTEWGDLLLETSGPTPAKTAGREPTRPLR